MHMPQGSALTMAQAALQLAAMLALIVLARAAASASRPNVLLTIFDDLRPALEPYGETGAHTPSLQALASSAGATTFLNAYVQFAVCGPSRTSFLTGRRPDSTKLYDFGSYWRAAAGNFSTFPELIRTSGYQTHSIGKIFHPIKAMKEAGHADDMPYAWSAPPYHPPTQKDKQDPICPPLAGVQVKNTHTRIPPAPAAVNS